MQNTVSSGMKRFANKKFILPLLFLLIVILVLMERGPFSSVKLKELSGGTGMLETQFGYGADQAYPMLDQIGISGRLMYAKLLGLDFLFIMVYLALQSLFITSLLRMANLSARLKKLNILPLVGGTLDIAENCLLLYLIASFPVQHTTAVWICSAVTIVKLAIYYGCMAIIFILGALAALHSIQQRSNRKKLKETGQVI